MCNPGYPLASGKGAARWEGSDYEIVDALPQHQYIIRRGTGLPGIQGLAEGEASAASASSGKISANKPLNRSELLIAG